MNDTQRRLNRAYSDIRALADITVCHAGETCIEMMHDVAPQPRLMRRLGRSHNALLEAAVAITGLPASEIADYVEQQHQEPERRLDDDSNNE